MKKVVIFSEDDYRALVSSVHDTIIEVQKLEDGYYVEYKLNEIYKILTKEVE